MVTSAFLDEIYPKNKKTVNKKYKLIDGSDLEVKKDACLELSFDKKNYRKF